MSKDNEAVELLRDLLVPGHDPRMHVDSGEVLYFVDPSIREKALAFLAKHDIMKCHCGGSPEMSDMGYESPSNRSVRQFKVWCPECGHAGKSAHSKEVAKRNWEFTQEAIREKRFNDIMNRNKKCPECGK